MKQTVDLYTFRDSFRTWQSGTYANNFTYEGLEVLFAFMEQYEHDTDGEFEFELDVVSFCCEYAEMDLKELNETYDKEFETLDDAEEFLLQNTIYCGKTNNTLVFTQF